MGMRGGNCVELPPTGDAENTADPGRVIAVALGDTKPPLGAATAALHFSVWVLLASLLLQRFVVPVGGDLFVSVVGPVGLVFGMYWLWCGALGWDSRRVVAFLVLAAAGFLGSSLAIALSIPRLPVISWTSLGQFLLLSSFAVLTFREPVDESRFFNAFSLCFTLIGVAGIGQFMAQFAGVSLFTFNQFLPSRISIEQFYNLQIPVGSSRLFKSNGFFLVEPSVFSQYMGLALAIEMVYFQRLLQLTIFSLGLVLSVSGTGWMVLGAFVVRAVGGMGRRGVAIGIGTAICAALALGLVAYALPGIFQTIVGRIDEFSMPGSSAHVRFVTPWWALSDVIAQEPWALFVGLGAGNADRLPVPYDYEMSTLLKVFIEYGLPGFGAYLLLFLAADRTPRQSAILFPAMVLFLFTGTYVQFAPILFPILLITAIARLRPS